MTQAVSFLTVTCSIAPAARTKLKKLQKEEEAKKAAAAGKSAADRSPHTKEVTAAQSWLPFISYTGPH